ncbi:hypothetical protein HDU98_007123 [Podochytrium sp. JEL0797]|nr:hypothetical protein HDU98_007123 [Podochytrium sp. JEL0797]
MLVPFRVKNQIKTTLRRPNGKSWTFVSLAVLSLFLTFWVVDMKQAMVDIGVLNGGKTRVSDAQIDLLDYLGGNFRGGSADVVRAVLIAYLAQEELKSASATRSSLVGGIRPNAHEIHAVLQQLTTLVFPFLAPRFTSLDQLIRSFSEQTGEDVGFAISCGTKQFYVAYHAILALRKVFQVEIPVQVFYAGDEDLNPKMVKAFNLLANVQAINLLSFFPASTIQDAGGWSLKPFVILACTFRTVIYMDSDVLFFKNPTLLLDMPLFRETGQVYFHDRRNLEEGYRAGTVWFRELLGDRVSRFAEELGYLNQRTSHEMDSGVVVMDKGRVGVLVSLLLACRMNSGIEKEVLGRYTYGDKESFWFSNELLRVPFGFSSHYGSVMGSLDRDRTTSDFSVVCGVHLLQLDENANPFWWNGGGVLKNREAVPKEFEFQEFGQMGFDLDGVASEWFPGHCLNRTRQMARDLNAEEQELLVRYRELFAEVAEVKL